MLLGPTRHALTLSASVGADKRITEDVWKYDTTYQARRMHVDRNNRYASRRKRWHG
jgi:hypothetical protein